VTNVNGDNLKTSGQLVPMEKVLMASGTKLLNVLPAGLDEDIKKDMSKAAIFLIMKACRENQKLAACLPDTIVSSLMDCATLGMIPFSKMNECTILPYGNKASMQLMYRGIIKLCTNTGEYKNIRVGVVREGDKLEYYKGLNQDLRHYESKEPAHNRKVTHIYALYELINGGSDFVVMTMEDIRVHRDEYSKEYKAAKKYNKVESSIWTKEEVSMSIKTVLIKLMKYAPKSDKLVQQLALDRDLKREIAPERKDFTEEKEAEFAKQRNADVTGVYEDPPEDKKIDKKEEKKPEKEIKKTDKINATKVDDLPDITDEMMEEESLNKVDLMVSQTDISAFYAKLTELGLDKAKQEKVSDWVKAKYKVKSKKELTVGQLRKALDAVIAKIEKNNLEKEGEKAIEEFNEQEPK